LRANGCIVSSLLSLEPFYVFLGSLHRSATEGTRDVVWA
jgi:hypothetical protein